ncbi:Oxidoreductase [Sporothrix eucalyptigena]|uniref:Mitochondrial intermembrane space import and assembly protein 40 n=1 Tax=Sporothrix eucalyptigena TaxID=1812306 RepID=A0ABP0B9R0_9PEZI
MYRASLRSSAQLARAIRHPAVSGGARRFASTTAGSSGGTWKGSVARWGLAAGALYWYNTSPIFADEATRHNMISSSTSPAANTDAATIVPDESEFRTVDALLEEKQKAAVEKKAAEAKKTAGTKKADKADTSAPSAATPPSGGEGGAIVGDGSPEALEDEASQQGAFNPETGEINWDCPCLGGMADGPCGEDFKAAFSCFVYSTEEPKGMDCIEKFQHMQDCFRKYPEIYGAELGDDEQEGEGNGPDNQQPTPVEGVPEGVAASESQPADATPAPTEKATLAKKAPEITKHDATAESSTPAATPAAPEEPAKAPKDDIVQADATLFRSPPEAAAPEAVDGDHVPKASFDATGANKN